jgi:hypothetical protein
VLKALQKTYPELRGVPLPQLKQEMQELVNRHQMVPAVAASVRQLQELLDMPEWNSDHSGDTRGYAFLMLAEGAIHEILRTANSGAAGTLSPSWRGRYDDRFTIELRILGWDGTQFNGIMTYPDDDTATSVTGEAEAPAASNSVNLQWRERNYVVRGQRTVDFDGSYAATATSDQMDADWRKGNRPIVRFTMTPAPDSADLTLN